MLYFVNHIYSIGILVTIFIALISLLSLGFFKNDRNSWLTYIKENGLNLYLALLIIAVLGSLFYSEFALFTPCKLCWWQRIFIIPQILLILVSKCTTSNRSLKHDVWNYLSWMTGFALFFSLVHNWIYYFGKENSVTCDAAASCKAYYVYEYGFVTIPFMTLGLLISLTTIILIRKYYNGVALTTASIE